ncbi:MAG: mechanosensitive ion channel family protein [Candidatus Glassbacteria bacterium]|nr:mechanosensitive ion channel family protein [Candidatus Glassbacteria bacterium]
MDIPGLDNFLQGRFMGQEIYRYLMAFGVVLASLVARRVFDKVISRTLRRWAEKTSFKYDDILIESLIPPVNALVFSLGIFFAIFSFRLPTDPYDLPRTITQAYHVTLSLIGVWVAYRLCDLIAEVTRSFLARQDEELADHFTPLVRQAIRVTVTLVGGIMIIQNLGYSVTSLVAGLGIGGLAIALAAQDTVANLLGTVVMFTDKPFKIGDWVKFNEVNGFVEAFGFRSVKVRTWSNTLLYVPNKMVTSEIIENCTSMRKRRVKMTVGVQYDSPPKAVSELVRRIEELLKNDEGVNQEYMLVKFTDFGPSSLDIFIYYFTSSTVWAEYLEVRQRINLAIMELVEELGLSFAFPSRTLYFGNRLELSDSRGDLRSGHPGGDS